MDLLTLEMARSNNVSLEKFTNISPELQQLYDTVYGDSVIKRMTMEQRRLGIPVTGFLTDMDGSIYAPGLAEMTAKVERVARSHNIPIIPITGYGFDQYITLVDGGELPRFPAIGSSSGAKIYVEQNSGEYKLDEYYEATIGKRVEWNRLEVLLRSISMYRRISQLLPEVGLEWQNWEKERLFLCEKNDDIDPDRVCFYFTADTLDQRSTVEDLAKQYFFQRHVIITERNYQPIVKGSTRRQYCLDINRLAKLDAARHLAAELEQGVVIGDGGNDLYMLRDLPNLIALITGSVKQELHDGIDQCTIQGQGRRFRVIHSPEGFDKNAYMEQDASYPAVLSVIRASKRLIWQYMKQNSNNEQVLRYWRGVYDDMRRLQLN